MSLFRCFLNGLTYRSPLILTMLPMLPTVVLHLHQNLRLLFSAWFWKYNLCVIMNRPCSANALNTLAFQHFCRRLNRVHNTLKIFFLIHMGTYLSLLCLIIS